MDLIPHLPECIKNLIIPAPGRGRIFEPHMKPVFHCSQKSRTGLVGHLSTGHFNPSIAIPLAAAAAIGGFLGTKLTVHIPPKKLKVIFALTSLIAAIIMVVNASG